MATFVGPPGYEQSNTQTIPHPRNPRQIQDYYRQGSDNLSAQLKMKKRIKNNEREKRSSYELQDLGAANEQQMLLGNMDETVERDNSQQPQGDLMMAIGSLPLRQNNSISNVLSISEANMKAMAEQQSRERRVHKRANATRQSGDQMPFDDGEGMYERSGSGSHMFMNQRDTRFTTGYYNVETEARLNDGAPGGLQYVDSQEDRNRQDYRNDRGYKKQKRPQQNKMKNQWPMRDGAADQQQPEMEDKAAKGFFSRLINKFQSLSKVKPDGEPITEPAEEIDEQQAEGKRIANIRKGRRKGKKNNHLHRKGDQLAINQEEESNESKLCKLCNRETPLYFYQQEDVVKRLPERALTQLLTDLKEDMEAKANYLKYLKISAKFINPCSCTSNMVHSYCMTAKIIRSQRIYCKKCGSAYNLFIKQEKMCSGKLLSLLFKYFLFLMIMFITAASFLILDAYLKTREAQFNPMEAKQTYQKLIKERDENPFNFGMVPDYTKSFNFQTSVRWTDMIHIVLIQIILMSWCFYFQFTRALQARKKLIYVEVRSSSERIQRILSKQNLNTVIETTLRKKNNNKLFDKFWYQTREEKFLQQSYDGLFVDTLNNVQAGIPQTLVRLMEREATLPKRAPTKAAEEKDTKQINKEIEEEQLLTQSQKIQSARVPSAAKKKLPHEEQVAKVAKKVVEIAKQSQMQQEIPTKKDTTDQKRDRNSEAMDSMVSFNPGSKNSSVPSNQNESKHIQVELKGQNQTMKFISSDALKEKVQQKSVTTRKKSPKLAKQSSRPEDIIKSPLARRLSNESAVLNDVPLLNQLSKSQSKGQTASERHTPNQQQQVAATAKQNNNPVSVFGNSFANYHFDRSEKDTKSDQQSQLSKNNAAVDATSAKVVKLGNSGNNTSNQTESQKEPTVVPNRHQASLESEMLPAMLDSERPRDEWNISHVKPDSQPHADSQPASIYNKQVIMTTHEDEFVALNNVLKDHMHTEQEDHAQEIVFPASRTEGEAAQSVPLSTLLADNEMIKEIGSEQRTNRTTSTEKKYARGNSGDFDQEESKVQVNLTNED